jgi:basic membrane protein A
MKLKKVLFLVPALVIVFTMTACGGGGSDATENSGGDATTTETDGGGGDTGAAADAGANIAFVLPADDTLGINDRGWIQMTWTGVKDYGDKNGKTYTWYKPLDNSTQGYYDAMTTAINSGSEVIISLGSQPVEATQLAQYDYPDTYFIAVEPNGIESDIADNTYAMFHQADQAGFFAGVAAVKGGFKNIGLLTGLDIPPMNIWTYGYLQGINYAAGKLGVSDIKVRHHYVNTSAASPEIQALAASWYEDGCDLIIPMMAGGNPSLFAAADAAGKPCFGGDVDQGEQSEQILTGAIKRLEVTVPEALNSVYNGTFRGGTYKWLNVDDGAVGLATDHWRVPNYTVEQYEADFNDFVNDVDGVRSGLLTEQNVRTDPNGDAFDALWNAIADKHVAFDNIK